MASDANRFSALIERSMTYNESTAAPPRNSVSRGGNKKSPPPRPQSDTATNNKYIRIRKGCIEAPPHLVYIVFCILSPRPAKNEVVKLGNVGKRSSKCHGGGFIQNSREIFLDFNHQTERIIANSSHELLLVSVSKFKATTSRGRRLLRTASDRTLSNLQSG
jgi:hypothetical protein